MKLLKKIELKPLLITIGMIILQTILYFLAKALQGEAHIIGGFIDYKIPFCNLFIIPYCIWYFLVFMVPYYLYIKDKNALSTYVLAYLICSVISDVIFVIYPTMVVRPDVKNIGFFNFITKFIYWTDTPPINCMPSLHCAISMLFILTIFSSKYVSKIFKIFIFITSFLIMLSTLFIKQHVFIDFLTGITIMIYVYIFVIHNKSLINKAKKLLHL